MPRSARAKKEGPCDARAKRHVRPPIARAWRVAFVLLISALLLLSPTLALCATPAAARSAASPAPSGAGAPARLDPAQSSADQSIRTAYHQARLPAPQPDPSLATAATQLAHLALASSAQAATDAEQVSRASDRAGVWDPPPRVIVVRSSPPERLPELIAARKDLASQRATHYGVGFAQDRDTGAAVILLVQRRATLEPFAHHVDVGTQQRLAGKLVFPLHDARVYVTGPSGRVAQPSMDESTGQDFLIDLPFTRPGRYTVEVVGQGAQGPEVVALFHVQAGAEPREPTASGGAAPGGSSGGAPAEEPAVVPEKRDMAKAEAQVLVEINHVRRARGVPVLARSATLDAAASEHANEMVQLNYFAHVSPRTGDVGQRLARLGFKYARVSENLGEAASALEAQKVIEQSPGHLANVVDPDVDLVGIAAVPVRRGEIQNAIVVEVFARQRK